MPDRSAATSSYWDEVPTLSRPASSADPAALSRLPRRRLSRRTALKGAMTLGGALALNVLGAVPTSRLRKAAAVAGNEYFNCAGYDSWSGYNNNTKICVGGTYGSNYCGGDGWFLNYYSPSFSSWPIKACGAGSLTDYNAWRWPHSGATYRCADGMQQVTGQSAVFRICSYRF